MYIGIRSSSTCHNNSDNAITVYRISKNIQAREEIRCINPIHKQLTVTRFQLSNLYDIKFFYFVFLFTGYNVKRVGDTEVDNVSY